MNPVLAFCHSLASTLALASHGESNVWRIADAGGQTIFGMPFTLETRKATFDCIQVSEDDFIEIPGEETVFHIKADLRGYDQNSIADLYDEKGGQQDANETTVDLIINDDGAYLSVIRTVAQLSFEELGV